MSTCPLGTQAYELDGPFSRPDDVVHMLEEAVSVLEGGGDRRITQRRGALHARPLRGRLHQPLHVGNGFFEIAADGSETLVTDPAAAKGLPNDKGGNAALLRARPVRRAARLLGYRTRRQDRRSKDPSAVAEVLEKKVAAEGAAWKSAGDYHHWAEGWANGEPGGGRTAYAGITFGALTPDPERAGSRG
jgi:hypothetical protein